MQSFSVVVNALSSINEVTLCRALLLALDPYPALSVVYTGVGLIAALWSYSSGRTLRKYYVLPLGPYSLCIIQYNTVQYSFFYCNCSQMARNVTQII